MREETLPSGDGTVEYRKIPGYDKYAAGSDGSIWSKAWGRWNRLKVKTTQFGYYTVRLYLDGVARDRFVHQLILEAFVGPKPHGCECRHFPDRNRKNNAIENLQWGTKRENALDRRWHGTQRLEPLPGASKITDDIASKIREEFSSGGVSTSSLAKKYGISRVTLIRVLRGKSWKNAGGPIVGDRDIQKLKLNEQSVKEIRRLLESHKQRDIAKMFGITQTMVSRIKMNKAWCSA